MKFALLVAASCIFAGAAFAASPEQTLLDIENGWVKAYVAKDTATLNAVIADDWLGQSDGATRAAKTAFVGEVKSGKLTFKAITLRDMKVRVFGTTAVVQGFDDETSSYAGKDTSGTYSWIDVFVNRGGKWVAIASQATKVKK